MKFAMETLAGLAGGVAGWLVVGFSAGWIMSSIWGHREGAQAMSGFFVIGPVGGLAGFAAAFWLTHRYLGRGGAAVASPHVAVSGLLALAIVLAGSWAVISVATAVLRPGPPVFLANGETGAIEFEIEVPDVAVGGRPVGELLSLAFRATDGENETVTPVVWKEERGHGQTKLTGRVVIDRRFRGPELVLKVWGREYSTYPTIPQNMHRKGPWADRLYYGHEESTPREARISATCRYVPVER
jgi:hypothetical protein